jgi:hypothetical protein
MQNLRAIQETSLSGKLRYYRRTAATDNVPGTGETLFPFRRLNASVCTLLSLINYFSGGITLCS